MEKDAIRNKNSKCHISKGHQTGSRRRYKNMVCYHTDVCIEAFNENELKKKTDMVLNRLRNAGMTINKKNA